MVLKPECTGVESLTYARRDSPTGYPVGGDSKMGIILAIALPNPARLNETW